MHGGAVSFPIGTHEVGGGRCFIIGEVGLAHEGSLQAAHAFVDVIAQAGADAVKFQCHLADHEPDAPMRAESFYRSRHEQWRRTAFDYGSWASLRLHAELKGMEFLCSPFSVEAVKLLDPLVHAWKVPSGEITNKDLEQAIKATGKPMLWSTGMADYAEMGMFEFGLLKLESRTTNYAVLQCTSLYPCPPESLGLNVLQYWHDERFQNVCAVGLSDHSGTIYAGLAAAALGCDVLEVHVKLSEWDQGPDASSSLTPEKLKQLVEGVRWIERAKAHPMDKDAMAKELEPMRRLFMRPPVSA